MIVDSQKKPMFEWVITDDVRATQAGLVGACRISEHHQTGPGVRAALQVAASLPCAFTVVSIENDVILRGKCSDIRETGLGVLNFAASGPIKLAQTFHPDAHRVQYNLDAALIGIYY